MTKLTAVILEKVHVAGGVALGEERLRPNKNAIYSSLISVFGANTIQPRSEGLREGG
jgi:hypothetical protein